MNGPEILIPILAITGTFSCGFLFIYLFFSSRHKQRMALIEHGKDASIFNENDKRTNKYNSLKVGLICVMLAVGILVSSILDNFIDDGFAVVSMALLFGGAGQLLYYSIVSKKEIEEMV